MYRNVSFGNIKKCPNVNCRAIFYKDCFKGYLPHSPLSIYAIIRCPSCRYTFQISQMIGMIHDYIESLPERKEIPNSITIFSSEDQDSFRKELFEDDNPLWNLYDGFTPKNVVLPPEAV